MRGFSSIASAFASFIRGFSGRMGAVFLFVFPLFLISPSETWSQHPSSVPPGYEWREQEDLTNVTVSLSTFSANTEDVTISVDTDHQGFVYTLTFGAGIAKRNPDGSVIEEDFIPAGELDNPLDLAIDEEGFIYVADYLDQGEFFDNGKIKVFDPQGHYLPARDILTSFFRPIGLAVDVGKVYVAEYNAPGPGPETSEMSRVGIYNKMTGSPITHTDQVQIPYRLAVNSSGQVFVSQAGDDDPAVLILDSDLSLEGELPEIVSPGSVVVDKFDYVHVIEYNNIVDFTEFLNFQELDLSEFLRIASDIDAGINDEKFEIKIYNSSGEYEGSVLENIDFPLDLAFSDCDTMYVNNVDVLLGQFSLDFDLEIFERTPSFDTDPPIAVCIPPGQEFTMVDGEVLISVDDINDGSTDNCGIESMTVSPETFTTNGDHEVTLKVTDFAGNTDTCTTTITVIGTAPELSIDCPEDRDEILDANCQFSIPDYRQFAERNYPEAQITQIPAEREVVDGSAPVEIKLQASLDGLTVSCSFFLNFLDETAPQPVCPSDIYDTYDPDEGYVVEDYRNLASGNDSCGEVTISQFPSPGMVVFGDTPIEMNFYDEAGNTSSCPFELILEEELEPLIECPDPETLPPLELDAECRVVAPEYRDLLTFSDGFVNTPHVVQTEEQDGNILLVTIEVYDGVGGTFVDACNLEIRLLDTTPPQIDCPASTINISPDEDGKYILPDYSNRASDTCDSTLDIVQDPPAGEITSGGTVTLYAVDDSGNASQTCEFEVVLLDEPEPEPEPIICVTTITLPLDANGQAQLDVEQLYEGELGTGGTAIVDKDFFTCTDLGEQPVTLDYSGPNPGSCNILVTVVDGIAPTPIARDIEIDLNENGAASITAEDLNNGSTDNCGTIELQYAVDQNIFACTDVGVNSVIFTVTDASGNAASIPVNVRVNDPIDQCSVDPVDPPEESFVVLFPNPSEGQVQIATSSDIVLDRVELFDTRGRLVDVLELTRNPVTRSYHLDLQKFQTGVYSLKLYSEEREYIRRAVITTF